MLGSINPGRVDDRGKIDGAMLGYLLDLAIPSVLTSTDGSDVVNIWEEETVCCIVWCSAFVSQDESSDR